MNPLLTALLAMAAKPYHAVSKPTLQAWARYRPAGDRLLGRMFQWTRAASHRLASEYGAGKIRDDAESAKKQPER